MSGLSIPRSSGVYDSAFMAQSPLTPVILPPSRIAQSSQMAVILPALQIQLAMAPPLAHPPLYQDSLNERSLAIIVQQSPTVADNNLTASLQQPLPPPFVQNQKAQGPLDKIKACFTKCCTNCGDCLQSCCTSSSNGVVAGPSNNIVNNYFASEVYLQNPNNPMVQNLAAQQMNGTTGLVIQQVDPHLEKEQAQWNVNCMNAMWNCPGATYSIIGRGLSCMWNGISSAVSTLKTCVKDTVIPKSATCLRGAWNCTSSNCTTGLTKCGPVCNPTCCFSAVGKAASCLGDGCCTAARGLTQCGGSVVSGCGTALSGAGDCCGTVVGGLGDCLGSIKIDDCLKGCDRL